ncbi:glycosyltransferase [Pseudoalteromonas sp. AOP31-A2-14]|uniref:glycosyltransferase n=1 Tax=unclassified Pseudoalteromonas TaxID=194690 RepID=UPI003F94B285
MKKELVISTVFSHLSKTKQLAEQCFSSTGIRSTIVCQLFELKDTSYPNEYTQAYNIIYSEDRGLARSRMLGVLASSADLIWIADDDIEVIPQGAEEAFHALEVSNADFITTKYAINESQERKKYSDSEYKHNRISAMKVSSIEIFVNKNKILNKGVAFDTRFGLGAHYKSGEENVFLTDILSKGGQGHYVPIMTSYHPDETSGGDFKSPQANESKGAIFRRVFGFYGIPLLIAFYLKRLLKKEIRLACFFSTLLVSFRGFFEFK